MPRYLPILAVALFAVACSSRDSSAPEDGATQADTVQQETGLDLPRPATGAKVDVPLLFEAVSANGESLPSSWYATYEGAELRFDLQNYWIRLNPDGTFNGLMVRSGATMKNGRTLKQGEAADEYAGVYVITGNTVTLTIHREDGSVLGEQKAVLAGDELRMKFVFSMGEKGTEKEIVFRVPPARSGS